MTFPSFKQAHKRSNKLEKLIFYAEVCVNLRKAVLSRLTSEEFTAMNDVRARLEDWEKVNKVRKLSMSVCAVVQLLVCLSVHVHSTVTNPQSALMHRGKQHTL